MVSVPILKPGGEHKCVLARFHAYVTGLQTRIVIPWKFAIFQKNNINIKSKITISGLLSSSKEFGPHGIN